VTEDEEDLMAEREPDERATEAPLQENPEPPVEPSAPEVDSARPSAESEESAVEETTGASLQVETEDVDSAAPVILEEVSTSGGEETASAEASEAPAPEAQEQAVSAETADEAAAQVAAPATAEGTPALEDAASTAQPAGAGAPAGEPGEGGGEAAWYVIHCYSGYENKVRHNLEQRIETMGMKDKIFDVVIPTQEEIEVRDGKRRTVERHIFPGYVLVNMALSEESWYVVRNTPGVTGFVGMGNLPTALRPEEVAQIVKRMEADAPTVKVSFKLNERVRIIDGPFNDFRGTVSDIDMERTKVRVMVSFFGRETPVELDFLQVEKA
jgi:transcriptional antiterminator NusG